MDHDLTGVLRCPDVSFEPSHLKSLMAQLLKGLAYIHNRGILHRDLKSSNILLNKQGVLKIADFGLARFYARNKRNDYTNRVITQWYKPPELLYGATIYGPEVDIWSAGCVVLISVKTKLRQTGASSSNFIRNGPFFKVKMRSTSSTSSSRSQALPVKSAGLE